MEPRTQLSLGDVRSYFLTTAKNELGVVMAQSEEGVCVCARTHASHALRTVLR